MRPVLPPPLKEVTFCTWGLARTMSTTWACSFISASEDVSSEASTVTRSWPMSSSGKKPFGMVVYSTAVSTTVPSASIKTRKRWRSAMSRVRA